MATLNIALQNHTSSATVYAYITGRAIDNNNALFLLQSDGRSAYYPSSPTSTLTALSADCAIPLGAPGNTVTVTIPHLAGARIWFALDARLTFYVNPGPALVEPSVSNASDPNYGLAWAFCEFTWNSAQLYANISYVDFVALPIALTLTTTAGASRSVAGLPPTGLDSICTALRAQNAQDGAGWDRLVAVGRDGKILRALSPNTGMVMDPSLFKDYYASYVDAVWTKYSSPTTLTVNTQGSAGDVVGKVVDDDGGIRALDFPAVRMGSYAKPAARDIFSCSTGPFAATGDPVRDAVSARLAAAFNRSTLLVDGGVTPDGDQVDMYYRDVVTNHYARICHEANRDGRGYAFPYDDVAPGNGVDQSGSVYDASPRLLTVAVGGGTAASMEEEEEEVVVVDRKKEDGVRKHVRRWSRMLDKLRG